MLTNDGGRQAMVAIQRARLPQDQEGRERSHLLVLYEPLVRCIMSAEVRVRDTLQVLLQLAGAELGLSAGVQTPL